MSYKHLKNRLTITYYFIFISFFVLFTVHSSAQDNYTLGVGIYDITGEIAETNYFGYADPFHRNTGIKDRQYARAFIVQEPDERPVVFVCIDKGATFQSVNLAVLEKLKKTFGDLYEDENVIISATHTHVATGGFSHFTLYELATGGYWKTNFDNLVNGIYGAIVRAHNTMKPGSIYFNKGSLNNASINRSLVAYQNNIDANEFSSIDEEMTVLKFTQSGKEVGMISWFAVHPTSLSNSYQHNSADNKGYAALKFERLKNSTYDESDSFVAAFANTNAGDLSPNLNLPPVSDPNQNATGPGENEEESTEIIGTRQYNKALELYINATTKLTGSVKVVSRYTDFSSIIIDPKFTDGSTQNTCKAALGVSFTAGAEDGRSGLGIEEGITKNPNFGTSIDLCHAEKPIAPLFYLGADDEDPATPKIVPTTLMKIGQLGILAVPAEFTVMSGRRTRATIADIENTGITETVLAGYSDAYTGYVTTREEYALQQYEGASTHFGPWTLSAYQQEFERLALKLADPTSNPWPDVEPEIPYKAAPSVDVTTPILFDSKPFFKKYGDIDKDVNSSYNPGDKVSVTFWGAHPNNDLKVNDTYLTVEVKNGSDWNAIYLDRDPITKLTWEREGISYSKINISWDIPEDINSGQYRIRHFGKSKQIFSGRLTDYTGTSSVFQINSNASKTSNNTNTFDQSIAVYPNPNKGNIFLEIKNDFIGSYEIIDVLGKTTAKGNIESKKLVPLELGSISGVYFLNIRNAKGENQTYMLLRE
ncbi:neutral/alkaline non-lysosomal ceramidase N-terminal domain-containing protein [Aquimarina pacifica]|uniref:neutral/alkaline non-lysosomal ceramidase N-terminal domain-containing protein n=1 Tax=Aquimarina pacifica TaxID=1296415 RepID=UPI00046F84CE|nr:neutral/alkaline non-lysosomal ceramidase N-terminal domain-containing protein [Aquimarina pacifica]